MNQLAANPDGPFSAGGLSAASLIRMHKDSRSSTVAELEIVQDGVQRRLIYKRFRVTGWSDPWAALVRRSSALRSWMHGHGFRERCLPTARPLLVMHRTGNGMLREGYLLTEKIEKAVDLRRVQMAYGLNAPVPSVAQGLAQEYGEREQLIIDREKPRSIIGTPESVTERLHALQEQFDADELIVLTVAGSYRARLRSYQLLAEAFDLGKS